jgi:hypothetical protein
MYAFSCSSVPIFKNLPEETLTKISDVLEEVSTFFMSFKVGPIFHSQYSTSHSVELGSAVGRQ